MTIGEEKSGAGNVTPLAGRGGSVAFGDHQLERLVNSFEVSARRWELAVYPSLFAFIVLACYGFYLIYSLTRDVGQLAHNVASLTSSVESMASNLHQITVDMGQVNRSMVTVAGKMDALEPMRESMAAMDQSTRYMAVTTERMGYHVGALNHNIGRPMGAMSNFMPW